MYVPPSSLSNFILQMKRTSNR